MNDRLDLDPTVTDWLRRAAPTRAPEHVLMAALERVAEVGQEQPLGGRRIAEWIDRLPRLRRAIVLAVVVAALLGAIAGAGALLRRSPIPPPGVINGWVVYSRHSPLGNGDARDGPMDIVLSREGIEPRRIVGSDDHLLRAACPTFAPDGMRLAYAEASQSGGIVNNTYEWAARDIVILGLDAAGQPAGSAVRVPVPSQGGDACPAWSSDGTKLAFLTGHPANLWIIPEPGAATRPADATVLDASALGGDSDISSFALSPDGAVIAAAGPTGIWLVPIRSGHARLLQRSYAGGGVSWSPDGSLIASNGGDGPATSVLVTRLNGTSDDLGPGSSPVWSPDGHRLAYERGTDIVVTGPDGSMAHPIALASLGFGGLSSFITWSPDGSRLLVAGWQGAPAQSAVISLSAAGDPAPVVVATESMLMGATGLSWQGVRP